MGTNFYLYPKSACPACGQEPEPLHIGKSSGGWCFSLHIMPDEGINCLQDWMSRFNLPGAVIKNEYGDSLTVIGMLSAITDRSWAARMDWHDKWWQGYASELDFHAQNQSERGPNGLLRHKVGRHCTGHGDGTYDYIPGEFS